MAATYLFVPLNFSLAKPGRTIYARGSLIIRRRHGRKGARFIAPCKIATAALVEKKMKKVVPGLIVLAIVIIGILGALTIESYLHPKITLRTQIQSPPQSLPAVPPQKVEEDLAAAPSTSATEPPSTDTTTTQIVLGPLITPPEEKPAIPVETKPQPAEAEIITDQMPTEEEATSTQAPTAGMGLLTDTGETAENRLLHPRTRQVTATMVPQPKKEKRNQVQKVDAEQTVKNVADLQVTMMPAGTYPFSILLETLDKRSNAEQAIALYNKEGLACFWVKVDLGEQGIKYRLFTGYFPSETAAKNFPGQRRLSGKLAKNTPYTARIGIFRDKNELAAAYAQAAATGVFPSILGTKNGPFALFVGAFYTAAGGDQQCRELVDKGLACQTVSRATPP